MFGSIKTKSRFLELLQKGPVVFDGAIGTALYERGVYFDHSFEELCLTQPSLVLSVHKSYVDIGVDVIKTNSYGANAFVLKKFDLENKVSNICKASVQIARKAILKDTLIAGSIGPTQLLPKDLLRSSVRKNAFDAFREAALALYEAGADLLLFETFRYLGELEIAIEAAYGLTVPLVAQVAFDDHLLSGDSATPFEAAERLSQIEVDAVGANCILGPERIHFIASEMLKCGKPVVLQPNVGFPKQIEGRSIYQVSPETYGVCARRAFKLGVRGYGGCCGTTPDYIRRVIAAARMMGRQQNFFHLGQVEIKKQKEIRKKSVEEKSKRSLLAKKLIEKKFIVSIEISPPVGFSLTKSIEILKAIEKSGVNFVNVPDGPRATVKMSNLVFCKKVIEETSLEPIIHVCGRDKNLLALQGTLLGAEAFGIKNTVIVTGDPPKIGDYPDAMAVFDLNSIGILSMANQLNSGIDPGGKSIGESTSLVLLTGAEPHATNLDQEIDKLKEKIDAGAEAVMTQPVYDIKIFEKFIKAVSSLKIPVLMGILPLSSAKNALFLHQNVPGMQIPEDVLKKITQALDNKAAEEIGIQIATTAIGNAKEHIAGIYFMPSLGRINSCLEVIKRTELLFM